MSSLCRLLARASRGDSNSNVQKHTFKAETKNLLNIVAKSLYSEPEVFIRELISNSSDAIEKLRYQQALNHQIADPDQALEIRIDVDATNKIFSIQDFGIGMNKNELVQNLGTIAHSGSKAFISENADKGNLENIIGKFGVGFYSVFMVGSSVAVTSKSSALDASPFVWESEGEGEFSVRESPSQQPHKRGTRIEIKLKENFNSYCNEEVICDIVKKYSNFINSPIFVNGKLINTVKPLWTMSASQITKEQHTEFYRFIANAWDEPRYVIQMQTDAPIDVRALLYIPTVQKEKFGLGQLEPGVSLYSRKVLIKSNMEALLPMWLRFIRGVVDSEDIPLNVSRELLQDTALIARLRAVLTVKIVKFLEEQAKGNSKEYLDFFDNYSRFIREGIYSDPANANALFGLMRFESSTATGQTSVREYISRMPADQRHIYYLCCASRRAAEHSPYLDLFKARGIEVLFMMDQMDPVIMSTLKDFSGKKIVSVESSEADEVLKSSSEKDNTPQKLLTPDEEGSMHTWLKTSLGPKVSEVVSSSRLVEHPALIVDHESSSIRRIRQMLNQTSTHELPAQRLEINASHPIIQKLNSLRSVNPEQAKLIAEQVFDNALIIAGLLDEPRFMIKRLNSILELAMQSQPKKD